MKIAVYANCQASAVARMLQMSESFRGAYEVIRVEPVHAITEEQQRVFLDEIVPELDVLVHQPIAEGFRATDIYGAEHVKSRLKPGATAISFPSLQFYGYQPTSFLIKAATPRLSELAQDRFGLGARELFHFEEIARSYRAGVDAAGARVAFDAGFDDARVVERMRATLDHMRAGEERANTDVRVADFIEATFRERKLFHTPRHPNGDVLVKVCERVFEILSLDVTPAELQNMRELEPLSHIKYPVPAHVRGALGLEFEDEGFRTRTQQLDPRQLVDRYYELYDAFGDGVWAHAADRLDGPAVVASARATA